jgi:hypothetical protein
VKGFKVKLAGVGMALATIVLPTVGLATEASAATGYGNVYLVVNNSRCFEGGHVYYIEGAVGDTWSGGDGGDNIIYPRVAFGQTNQFNGYAYCSGSWESGDAPYMIDVVGWNFHPTGWNQTFWY